MDLKCSLPPIVPTIEDELEDFLFQIDKLPIHDIDHAQKFWSREPSINALYSSEICQVPTRLQVDRDPLSGEVMGYKEVPLPHAGLNPHNSMSLQRAPGPPDEWVRGSVNNIPFWPGGMAEPTLDDFQLLDSYLLDFETNLLTTPPGFDHGVNFGTLNTAGAPANVQNEVDTEGGDVPQPKVAQKLTEEKLPAEKLSDFVVDESVLPFIDNLPVLMISEATSTQEMLARKTEWATRVDVSQPVEDFHLKVPQPAFTWPFELDTFQKQAIIHLEKAEDVFIAAHTSAGKTVIAEYAIALSQKHMTKAIYTSPIKALSNQKFRDFKTTFQDVGLLTGDVQINTKASCLIMTTEILRSMLYNGSDITRDLEWVIFDEVHYINDAERGVVWEEVLILLPAHVHIVMLSATVPNTLEFASWVGRTKGRHMYVISTPKRPVPLEHHLYTGTSAKTKEQLFVIVDAQGNFVQKGYTQAMDAKKPKEKTVPAAVPSNQHGKGGALASKGGKPEPRKPAPSTGGQHTTHWGPNQDKTLWNSLIDYLGKEKKLPVVAFTLSRNRCDQNASLLSSLDLCTAEEKGRVHQFFLKCVSRLKPADQRLPQVVHMRDLLKRGIGVHHSGILPILKEVVEMLFQEGLVKLLFATETFAMGVNMPARTVVFDSIRKHDGTEFRNLRPAEYIQMAGRAGRRGLDSTGTVIILCKMSVPEAGELHSMMLGKPQKLESQFRVTYSMILNLLRVEGLRVEDVMKKAFGEFNQQSQVAKLQSKLEVMREQVRNLAHLECSTCSDVEEFYNYTQRYLELKETLQKLLLTHPQMVKELTPGRVLLIHHNGQLKLALLLSVDARTKDRLYKVFILTSPATAKDVSKEDNNAAYDYRTMIALARGNVECPTGTPAPSHSIITLKCHEVMDVTKVLMKIEADKIIKDWENRQVPRFRDNPPGQSCIYATDELYKLCSAGVCPPCINPVSDLKIRDYELAGRVQEMESCYAKLTSAACLRCQNFDAHMKQTYNDMKVKDELRILEFKTSEESLTLLPDYQSKLNVLKRLKYVSESGTVELKGQVACIMGNHELMITELVFENILTELPPAEIAALLSCLVFQQRNASEPELTPSLIENMERIKSVARRIGETQAECGIKEAVGDFVDQFNFGLTEVVYEWAKGMPFAEIMGLTDVQEGMIVRCIQRLDETLRDVHSAARIVGDPVLSQKMEEASTAIKRDIVFAASLYTQ